MAQGQLTAMIAARPGTPASSDFSLLVGLGPQFDAEFEKVTIMVQRLPNVFGDGADDAIVVPDTALLVYDPATPGLTEAVVEQVLPAFAEIEKPECFICAPISQACREALHTSNIIITPVVIHAWDGKPGARNLSSIPDSNPWRACGRILLTHGVDQPSILASAQARENKHAVGYEVKEAPRPVQTDDPDSNVVPGIEI